MHRYLPSLGLLFFLATVITGHIKAQVGVRVISKSTQYREIQPQITADGQTLYFTRGRHPRNQGAANSGDIWLRKLQADGSWGRALNAGGPINSFSHDEVIGISTDGQRLAVLRRGVGDARVDLLKKGVRSWRITSSKELSSAFEENFSATYDLETDRLIYCRSVDGQRDLFIRTALNHDDWSEERSLAYINSTGDDYEPYLSPDGNTLYFRKNGEWHRADYDRERNDYLAPASVNEALPRRFLEIAMSVNQPDLLFASTDEAGNDERLVVASFPETARPAPTRLLSGQVAVRERGIVENGDLRLSVAIDDRRRTIYPDHEGNYTIVVPAAGFERFAAKAPGYFTTVVNNHPADNEQELAAAQSTKTAYSPDYYARERSIHELHQKISVTTAELAELNEQRKALKYRVRETQLRAGQEVLSGYIDPELSKLRSQLVTANDQLRPDTIPAPKSTPPKDQKPSIRNESNAAALDELEALRSRFRASQEATMGADGRDYDWKKADPISIRRKAEQQINEELIPTISQEIVRQTYADEQIDSLAMEGNIRSSLFTPPNQPAVYERKSWENELIDNIDPAVKTALREKLEVPLRQSMAEDQQLQKNLIDRGAELRRYQDSLARKLDAQLAEESRMAPTTYGNTQRPTTMTAKGVLPPSVTPSSSAYQPPVSTPQQATPNRAAPPMPTTGVYRQPASESLNSPSSSTGKADELELIPFAKGNVITLGQLRFAPNSAVFKPGTERELDRLAENLRANPDLMMEIGVHGNSRMSYSFARELTQQRADRILAYLTVELGLAASRIKAVGYGREHPIADGSTVEGRLKNQRIEVKLY
ncbi:hypothetical protein CEQ90_15620 [Lewinellaceae bacterium SD302]|nr:hypothetical protein CEQ90_15620 [Lewinellaceae bacterium SD302]